MQFHFCILTSSFLLQVEEKLMHRQNLISAGASVASHNKRYVVWFFLLNLLFAWWGAAAFTSHAREILDHSLYADKLLHGFDLVVLIELIARPEFGPTQSSTMPATLFAILFFLTSLIFMPGVLLGYSSDHRISREEFFRACGHNLWRFVRLFVIFAVIAGIIGGILFGAQDALVKAVDRTANDDRLPFLTQMLSMAVIFLVLTVIRIWFDLAQTDVVLRDQKAVRKSLGWAFRATRRNFGRLLGTYVVVAIVGLVILAAGIVIWYAIVPPSSVLGAFIVSQAILLLLLAVRFWQRASAVAFYVKQAIEPEVMVRAPVMAVPMATGT
jgi:hypothetical protein